MREAIGRVRRRDASPKKVMKRVLLVDDHESFAEATAEFLQGEGMEVRIASSGRDALELVVGFRPDIVLCDLQLPDISGFDIARALRATPAGKDLVLVIHTAMSERELRVLAHHSDAPVNEFVSKPLTRERLADLVSKVEFLQRSTKRARSREKRNSATLELRRPRKPRP